MERILSKMSEYFVSYGFNVVGAILIVIVGRWLAGIVAKLVEQLMVRANIEKTLASFARNVTYSGFFVFVIIAALNKLGVETTSLIAIIGAAGLAVGLALQGSLSNFAAGIILVVFKPFKVGDFIEAGGTMGTVVELQIFNTILNHPDNRRIVVPNSKVTSDNISNFSAIDKRRIDLVFSISYSDDIKKAKETLEKIVSLDPRVLKDPKPLIAVSALADSSVNLVCRPWVKPGDYWNVYFDTLEKGKVDLEKNGITIPFPQRDVHMYQEKK